MVRSALFANPVPNGKIFRFRISLTAYGAGLRTWIEGRHLNDICSVEYRLVFQHTKKLCSAYIGNRFCQLVILHHVLHLQILYADGLVFTHQLCRDFMQEILSGI